jgi:hypothetical protein
VQVAILPRFVSLDGDVALQMVVPGVVSVLLGLPILVAYGFASALPARSVHGRLIERIEGIGGGIPVRPEGTLATSPRGSQFRQRAPARSGSPSVLGGYDVTMLTS